jgi:hypothetical protein
VVITTNGYVKADGTAVMGRGCAHQAARRWPWLPRALGLSLRSKGNVVAEISRFVMYPVKPEYVAERVNVLPRLRQSIRGPGPWPGWMSYADLELVERSAEQIQAMAVAAGWQHVLMPRPGCGNGELSWDDVVKRLSRVLDDRFTVVTW